MALSTLLRHVGHVRRRLFLSSLLAYLAWCWVGALALSAGWLFVQPLLIQFPEGTEWLRWVVPGLLALGATVLASTLAVVRSPSQVTAALSLDEKFSLRERVTTSLTLTDEHVVSSAGQALLADAEKRLAGVRVGDRFPVQMPWKPAVMLPVLLAGVVLLALLWEPKLGVAGDKNENETKVSEDARSALEEQVDQLARKKEPKKTEEPLKSDKIKEIEAEIDKFTQKPRDTRDQLEERIKDATSIEAELQRQEKIEAQRADMLRKAMEQANRMTRKNREEDRKGPAKQAQDALARGDMSKTKDELDRLSRQMEKQEEIEKEQQRLKKKIREEQDPEKKAELEKELDALNQEQLTDKDKEDLKRQLEEMKDMVDRLTRKEEQEKELEKQIEEEKEKEKNEKDPEKKKDLEEKREELERELDEMRKNELTKEQIEELEELAKELGECQQCMKEGKEGEAAKRLAKAAQKAGKMGNQGDREERARMLQKMQQVRKAMNKAAAKGGAGVGAGRRPEDKDENTGHEEKQVRGQQDEKGKWTGVGVGPKGGKKFDGPRKPTEMEAEIKEAGQEAAAAIDRQRMPPSARKMAQEYFDKLRGPDKDKNKDAKK